MISDVLSDAVHTPQREPIKTIVLTAENFLDLDGLTDTVADLIGHVHCDVEITVREGDNPTITLLEAFNPKKYGWAPGLTYKKGEDGRLYIERATEMPPVMKK